MEPPMKLQANGMNPQRPMPTHQNPGSPGHLGERECFIPNGDSLCSMGNPLGLQTRWVTLPALQLDRALFLGEALHPRWSDRHPCIPQNWDSFQAHHHVRQADWLFYIFSIFVPPAGIILKHTTITTLANYTALTLTTLEMLYP